MADGAPGSDRYHAEHGVDGGADPEIDTEGDVREGEKVELRGVWGTMNGGEQGGEPQPVGRINRGDAVTGSLETGSQPVPEQTMGEPERDEVMEEDAAGGDGHSTWESETQTDGNQKGRDWKSRDGEKREGGDQHGGRQLFRERNNRFAVEPIPVDPEHRGDHGGRRDPNEDLQGFGTELRLRRIWAHNGR